jgi:hypothetical protein
LFLHDSAYSLDLTDFTSEASERAAAVESSPRNVRIILGLDRPEKRRDDPEVGTVCKYDLKPV